MAEKLPKMPDVKSTNPRYKGAMMSDVARALVTDPKVRARLGPAWLPEHPARSPLRRPELLTYTHHTTSSALGAQKFPSAASSTISLSSVKSADGARGAAPPPSGRAYVPALPPDPIVAGNHK